MDTLLQYADSLAVIVLITMACGYFSGAIPVGLMITQWATGKDIRQLGSGGTGATNVLRNVGRTTALLTLMLDMAKGAVPCAIFYAISPPFLATELALIAGFAAIVGHIYPCWANFAGGKGVATALGVIAVLQADLLLVGLGLWLLVAAVSRVSSLSSLMMILSLPLTAAIIGLDLSHIFTFSLISLLIIIRHRENIQRLLAGSEGTISLLEEKSPAHPEAQPVFTPPAPSINIPVDEPSYATPNTDTANSYQSDEDIPPISEPEAAPPVTENPPKPEPFAKQEAHTHRRGYFRPEMSAKGRR